MPAFLILTIAILAEVVATSALKASAGFTRLVPSAVAICLYGIAFYSLSLALKVIPVGLAYAIWAGAGIVLISIAGWLVFGQVLDAAAIVGLGLIVAGVVIVNTLSGSIHR